MWAVAKVNFAKLLLINDQPMTRSRFEQLVLNALNMISPAKIARLYGFNQRHVC